MKNLKWMTMAALLASNPLALTLAHAAEEAGFEACKNVVRLKDQKQVEEYQKKGCKVALDFATPNASDTAKTSVAIAHIQSMLSDVADTQYKPDLQKRIKYWEGVKACFKNPSSSSKCKEQVEAIQSSYGGFVADLRASLAQANVGNDKKVGSMGKFDAKEVNFVPDAFPESVKSDLSPSEASTLNQFAAQSSDSASKMRKEAQDAYKKTMAEGILKNGMFLVSYLPKPKSVEGGLAKWSTDDWTNTVDRLIKDAKHEIEITDRSVKRGTVTFPPVGTRDFIPFYKTEERDLMSYATMKPEMEKYLEKHPGDCGAALAAVKWIPALEHEKMRDNLIAFAAGGAVMGAGIGVGAEWKSLGTTARILSGAATSIGGYAGAAMLLTDYQHTQEKYKSAQRQTAKIGVEKDKNGKSIEGDVVDPQKFAEAKEAVDGWFKNQAIGLAAFGGGAAIFGKATNAIAKLALKPKSKVALAEYGQSLMLAENPEALSRQIATTAPEGMRPNIVQAIENPETRHAITLAKSVNTDLRAMANDGTLKDAEVAEVTSLLQQKHGDLASNFEAQGKCKGEACFVKAAQKEGDALHEAKGVCAPGKGAK